MSHNSENIDQLFKSTLEGYTQTPPVGFEAIASQVGNGAATAVVKGGLSGGIKAVLVATSAACVGGLAYWINKDSSVNTAKEQSIASQIKNSEVTTTNDSSAQNEKQNGNSSWIDYKCLTGINSMEPLKLPNLEYQLDTTLFGKLNKIGIPTSQIVTNKPTDSVSKSRNESAVVSPFTDAPKTAVKCRELYSVQAQEVENKAVLFQVQPLQGREISSLKWYFGDGSTANMVEPKLAMTFHRYYVEKPKPIKCVVVVQLSSGCKDSQMFTVQVNPIMDGNEVLIPNVFTPNSDGKNDVYRLTIPEPKQMEFMVLDARNQPVFKATSISETWDGSCGNLPCKEGDYKAILKREYSGEKPLIETYIIHLTRNNNQ